MAWSIGQTIHVAEVRRHSRDTARVWSASITKIGRTWATIRTECGVIDRFDLETGEIDQGEYSTADAYAFETLEDAQERLAILDAWDRFKEATRRLYSAPWGLKSADVKAFTALITAAVAAERAE